MRENTFPIWRGGWVLLTVVTLALAGAGCSRESKKARHLERADRYFEAKQFDKAAIEYLNLARLESTNVHAISRLATIYYSKGEFAKAAPLLLRTEQLAPEDLSVRLRLATIYLAARQPSKARQEALFILEREPASSEALLLLADASQTADERKETQELLEQLRPQAAQNAAFHLAVGTLSLRQRDFKAAEAAFREALRLDATMPGVHVGQGNLYWALGELAQADSSFKAAADLAKPNSVERLKWIEFKIRTGALADAKQLLQDTIQAAPNFLPALSHLAEIALAERNYAECAALIDRVLALDSNSVDALVLRARLHLAQGEVPKAVEEFERLAERYPRLARLHYHLGGAYLQSKDPVKAAASLTQAVTLDPNLVEATLLLAELNVRRGDTAAAITALTQLIKQRPKLATAYYLLAAAYAARGTPEEALGVYRDILKQNPRDAHAHFQMALLHLQQNKRQDARAALNTVLDLATNSFPAVSLLVELDIADKDFTSATKRAQEQVAKFPKSATPHYLLAKVHSAQKQTDEAEAELLKALELDPNYRPAYTALARLYLAANKHEQALQRLEGSLTRNPKDTASLLMVGMLYEKKEDYAKAVAAYERLLQVQPDSVLALNNLAYVLAEHLKQPDKAHDLARRARESDPNNPYVADTLGWILCKRADYGRALSLFQEATEKLPEEPEVMFHLGMAHYALGEEAPARLAFQKAIQLNKEFNGQPEAERRLALLNLDTTAADATAMAALESRLREQADDTVALLRLAAVHEKAGAFDQAKATYERVLKSNPRAVLALSRLAELYAARLKDPKKALELGREARNLAPENPDIALVLGRLALNAGDHAWALSVLQDSVRRKPDQAEARYYLAWAAYAIGRVAEARDAMQQFTRSQTGSPLAAEAERFLKLTALYPNPGPAPQAEALVNDALKSQPDHLPALLVSALLKEKAGQADEARSIYEGILARSPAFAPAAKQLAALYVDHFGDYDKAFALAVKAREALPEDTGVAKTLGKVVYRRGDFGYAAQLLKQSAAQETHDAELFYYLGMAHYRLKEKQESAEALRRALALNDKAGFAEEARRVLAEVQ
jgi:tetratricopeptide (TPR) repeat protein